jgi:hypothetical protein
VNDLETFPNILKLIKEADINSLSKVKDQKQICHGLTIAKSISEKKRTLTLYKKEQKEELKTSYSKLAPSYQQVILAK